MPRVTLITDADTILGEQLVRRCLAAGHCVAAVVSPAEAAGKTPPSEEDRLLRVDWNRTSPISARNVVLAVLNRFETLDVALLLQAPQLAPGPLQGLSYEDIERAVDAWVKGTLFLAKGVLEVFAQHRAGTLALIQQPSSRGDISPLAAALRGSLRAAARSLAARTGSVPRPVRVNTFECRDTRAWDAMDGAFADYVLRTMRTRAGASGRCFRFPGWSHRLRRLVLRRPPQAA